MSESPCSSSSEIDLQREVIQQYNTNFVQKLWDFLIFLLKLWVGGSAIHGMITVFTNHEMYYTSIYVTTLHNVVQYFVCDVSTLPGREWLHI